MTDQKPKIFLSYAHEDLKRYDLDIWFDNVSLLPGQNWKVEIKKAIRNSTYFLALLSSKSVDHVGYVQKELKIALEILDLYPESGIFIIPIRFEECKPSHEKLYDLHWIDLFPEDKYENGIRKILKVVSPRTILLRSQPSQLSRADVTQMIREHGFHDGDRNPKGCGFSHQYKEQEIGGDKVIFDKASGLMWQQGGSSKSMELKNAKKWIEKLNHKGYAREYDWRLPTLEEAMSLVEREMKNGRLYIDSVFDRQLFIWTSDLVKSGPWGWVVNFGLASSLNYHVDYSIYVRAVRSVKSSGE